MIASELRIHVNRGAFTEAPAALLERAVRETLSAEGQSAGEVSLTLLGDDAVRELNKGYLGKDRPTDVISFSLGDGGELLGDVYVGVPQARRQAAELGVDLNEELVRLAIHGVLHVLGHDHPEGPEREHCPMYALQEAYLKSILASGTGSPE